MIQIHDNQAETVKIWRRAHYLVARFSKLRSSLRIGPQVPHTIGGGEGGGEGDGIMGGEGLADDHPQAACVSGCCAMRPLRCAHRMPTAAARTADAIAATVAERPPQRGLEPNWVLQTLGAAMLDQCWTWYPLTFDRICIPHWFEG